MDHLAAGAFIGKNRPGSVKMRSSLYARAADMIAPSHLIRNSADCAERRNNQRHLLAAGVADVNSAGIRYESLADVAERGKNKVKNRSEK
jgi:hypothetical protein